MHPSSPSPAPLPRFLTGFVGRERERDTLASLLLDPKNRLITITGPGGIGKTRFAVEAVSSFKYRFPDGIAFIPLATTNDPDRVPALIAESIGLFPQPDVSAIDALREALRNRSTLLVLDNFEHLLPAGALLSTLLTHCPDLTILVTSRVRLGLSGELSFLLNPLTPHDAHTLFRQRARSMHASAPQPDHDDASIIQAICLRLDNIPLAIELAAARTATLALDALLDRLSRPLAILQHGPRDVPLRQQTMRDTIAWSYALLDEAQQKGFLRLSVFVGGFPLEGAEAVLPDAYDALDLVDFLVAHSLVIPMSSESGQPRFTMLESIRQFGFEMLAASPIEHDTARTAHVDWLIRRIEPLTSGFNGPQLNTIIVVHNELDNIRAALAWAIAQGDGLRANRLAGGSWAFARQTNETWLHDQTFPTRIHCRVAQLDEWIGLLEAALVLRSNVPYHHLCEPLASVAGLLAMRGCYEASSSYAQQMLEGAILAHDLDAELAARLNIASCAGLQHNWSTMRAELAIVQERSHLSTHSAPILTFVHAGLAQVARAEGSLAEEESHLLQALAFGQDVGFSTNTGANLLRLAWICAEQGRLREANQHVLTAIRTVGAIFDAAIHHMAALNLAHLALANRQPELGIRLLASSATVPPLAQQIAIDDAHIAPFRAAITEPAFSIAWEEGTRLTWTMVRDHAELIASEFEQTSLSATPEPQPIASMLSPREIDVLRLVVAGGTNRQVGEALFISDRTVETHLSRIMTRLGISSRTALVAWAVRQGIVA